MATLHRARDIVTRGCRNGSGGANPCCSSCFIGNTRPLVKRLVGNECMVDGFVRLQPSLRVPSQATRDKVEECLILCLEGLRKGLRAWSAPSAFTADSDSRFANGIEEELLPGTALHQMSVRRSKYLHDTSELLLFVFSWEQRIASPELSQDATKRPHVDTQPVGAAENNLRTAVETRLNVRVHLLFLLATASKVNDPDIGLASLTEEDVLRLEIAVDDALVL